MDSSEQVFSRLFTDDDLERARRMISQEERVVMLCLELGIDIKPAALVKEFGMNRYQAERLIEKIRQQKFSAQTARKKRARGAQNPRSPK